MNEVHESLGLCTNKQAKHPGFPLFSPDTLEAVGIVQRYLVSQFSQTLLVQYKGRSSTHDLGMENSLIWHKGLPGKKAMGQGSEGPGGWLLF